jgi:hypothetical protein
MNDVIVGATRDGHLAGRVVKAYRYFDCQEKDEESERYPKIVYVQYFARQIPWFIESQIDKIAAGQKTRCRLPTA